MTTEIDLPCADCGTDLRERTLPTRERPIGTERHQRVTVAECPACSARYYPADTLTQIGEAARPQQTEGSSRCR